MKIDVDKLLSEDWHLYNLGKITVLGAPPDSEWARKAAIFTETTYRGKIIHFPKYVGFPWDEYIKDKK
jgi:hypothetical protein